MGIRWYEPERLLVAASALLLAANFLLILAVFLNFIGSLGGWDAGETIWVAFGADLVGVAALGPVFFGMAGRTQGRSRVYRKMAGSLLLAWVGLTAFWRFAVPAVMGTTVQDLFLTLLTAEGALPARITRYAHLVYELFGLWIASAAVFLVAHVVIVLDARIAAEDDWARGLPVYAWVLAAGISFAATVLIVVSFLSVLGGGPLADNFAGWAIAKLLVAPNIFMTGYASSLHLGRGVARGRSPPRGI